MLLAYPSCVSCVPFFHFQLKNGSRFSGFFAAEFVLGEWMDTSNIFFSCKVVGRFAELHEKPPPSPAPNHAPASFCILFFFFLENSSSLSLRWEKMGGIWGTHSLPLSLRLRRRGGDTTWEAANTRKERERERLSSSTLLVVVTSLLQEIPT